MSTATQSLRPLVDRARRRWRASPLPAFGHWWAGELRALLPPRWRGWFAGGADWYLLEVGAKQWTLRRTGHADVLASWDDPAPGSPRPDAPATALQRVDREDLRLALLLPDAAVLRRTLALPLAARDSLAQAMAFEMDRQTPFQLAQVHYAVRELHTPAPPGRFNAELLVVTRASVDPLLARLRAAGLVVDAVDVTVGNGRLGVNLLPPELTPRHAHPRRRLNLALAGACVLLLVALLGQWLHNRELALAQMQGEVDSMRADAQQVSALRQQLQDNAGAAGFLAQRKQHSAGMLSVLQDVTVRLPDSTWLERFNVDDTGQVGLQGQAQQAARLLDALKDSPVLAHASFQGSIQPDPSTGKERFYLTAQLRKGAPAARSGTP